MPRLPLFVLAAVLALTSVLGPAARAQDAAAPAEALGVAPADAAPLTLTLDDALALARARNFDVRTARLDVETADAQVREAWGEVYPSVDVSSNYTRNVVQANPFAGSDVTSILGGGSRSDWAAYNEQQRLDGDPSTMPIPFDVFRQQQQEARDEAGISFGGGGNPFGVDNEFRGSVSVTQPLFDGAAFASIRGAQQFKEVSARALDRQRQVVDDQVRTAFHRALLADAQVQVVADRADRTRTTLREVTQRVRRGTAPKYQRLSTEVELANVETELVQARREAGDALDALKRTLGLAPGQPVRLQGALDPGDGARLMQVAAREALSVALAERTDLERARQAVALREVDLRVARAGYLPRLSAVADLSYIGRVPDDRARVLTDPADPFFFAEQDRAFFSSDFWNPNVTVGLQLTWNVFNGFQTTARVEQRTVAVAQAQVDYDRLRTQVEVEVRQAVRALDAARQRLASQQQNVTRAETNYTFTEARVAEGVSTQLELREASDQLDQSRLGYLQAAFDYVTARSALATALGVPLRDAGDLLQLTSNVE